MKVKEELNFALEILARKAILMKEMIENKKCDDYIYLSGFVDSLMKLREEFDGQDERR